jgi:predicted nuclease of predicted toxin-antitoxin system
MKILIDMNLSPDWVAALAAENIESVHWSTVGDPRAEDTALMQWARTNDYVVFTHDLDFGAILALTQVESPSVVLVRTQDVLPSHLANTVITVLRENESWLKQGALIVVDEGRARVRILPLQRRS